MKLVLTMAWMARVSGSMSGQDLAKPGQPLDTIQGEDVAGVMMPEVPPSFPGGTDSLKAFVQKNLKYPRTNREKPGGKVFVEFVVRKDGSLAA